MSRESKLLQEFGQLKYNIELNGPHDHLQKTCSSGARTLRICASQNHSSGLNECGERVVEIEFDRGNVLQHDERRERWVDLHAEIGRALNCPY